ncbi:hypothetical protein P3X46_007706 [Hevea brasiliensis]|uniref:Avr9/Cf-9 rapidly elicited protein 146 n=1 Tax=Hevea brasiliensis TaxID=3981 RepID=A0ABQ9MUD7_HEVBR|nr:uncharacterized protein LOC110641766 [Hevea brasiliensis]KAJ9183907.1 hypothetical protein P3X46_007706 [Hevea brasiliensis]
MEMESSTPEVAKKLWHIVRVVFFMLRKGISKSRIMVDLHLMLKRGNKLAGKAIVNLMYHHHNSSFSCRSNDSLSFISPREYEFSCSNSPAFHPFNAHKRKHHHHFHFAKSYKYDDVTTMAAAQKMFDMLNNHEQVVEASPMVLPGFGKSPIVRQLRITDSPFPLKDEGDSQVDKAAEEFIKKFYKDLKLQKTSSAFESPHNGMWGR